MKSAEESKERLLSQMMIWGGGFFLAGLLLTFLAGLMRSVFLFALGPVSILLGMAVFGSALYMGFSHNRKGAMSAPSDPYEGRVVARFAINQIGEMLFDNFDYDAEEARYYVRMQFLDGRRLEYECGRPVFDVCGEGMRGMITTQGNWLSSFQPLADTDETRAAYRDW